MTKQRARIAESDDWVGDPALIRGAGTEQCRRLYEDVEHEIAPTNIFEKLEARDISYKLAEEERLRHLQTAIVETARVEALADLLVPTFGQNVEKARKTAQDYFASVDDSQRAAKALVDQLGISMENIEAHALHLRMSSIHALDDMIDRREVGRNRIIKRLLKRKKELKVLRHRTKRI